MTRKRHATIAAICLLLGLSPLGAPAVGALITLCPEGAAVSADGPFALPLHDCGIWLEVERAYQKAMFLPVVAASAAGRPIGVLIEMSWLLAAVLLPFAFIWHAVRAVLRREIEAP